MSDLEMLISLNMSGVVGPVRYRRLVEKFKDSQDLCTASERELASLDGFGKTVAEKIKRVIVAKAAKRELDRASKLGIHVIPFTSDQYPLQLKMQYDAPLIIYVKGEIDPTSKSIAMVGSRHGSSYGRKVAYDLSFELAGLGFCVVSGLARGIDTAAHKGALKARGRTIAVLGSGIASIYPPENERLAEEIAVSGALISEFPIDSQAVKTNFPRRNRIISGLSLGTVVVEGSLTSGALITAEFALEQGREVFAIPGAVSNPMSKGPHMLIKQGAKLVENVFDIIEEIDPTFKQVLSPLERQILGVLSDKPATPDTIQRKTGIMPNVLQRCIGKLVQKGLATWSGKGYCLE